MPNGVPVATVAVNASQNAGILAAQILGASDKAIQQKMIAFKDSLKEAVLKASEDLKSTSPKKYL